MFLMQQREPIVCTKTIEKNTLKNAKFVEKITRENKHSKSTALALVGRSKEYLIGWILWIGIAAYVRLYSIVINMLLRKHVVRNSKSF